QNVSRGQEVRDPARSVDTSVTVPGTGHGRFGRGSGAVAALELLARAAPARVVAADVLVGRLDDRSGRDGAAAGDRRGRGAAPGGRDRLCACNRLVLVVHVTVATAVLLFERGGVGRLDLRMEE